MQIFHWLVGVKKEQTREDQTKSASDYNVTDKEAKVKDIVLYGNRRGSYRSSAERSKSKTKSFGPFPFLCRKDVAKACFYSTLNLKRVNEHNDRRNNLMNLVKIRKEEIACAASMNDGNKDSGSNGGNRVLPVNDTTMQSSREKKDQRLRGDKSKTLSKMKELLRWAAATKSEQSGKLNARKAIQHRNRPAIKAVSEDDHSDQVSNDYESPKISFRWEVESSLITSSAPSISLNSIIPADDKRGNWITTDSEFVVLEL